MPTIPLIMSRPTFLNKPLPVSGAFRVQPNTPCEVVKAPVNPALLAAVIVGDRITVTLQRNGTSSSGPNPVNTLFTEVLSAQRIQLATTQKFIGMEICSFRSLPANTVYTLRINITEAGGLIKAISTNLTLTL